MDQQIIRLNPYNDEHRFSRFELIRWWDQKKLSNARILVIGAGALGNEIIKNLALLGVGNIIVADMDKIENSNLSRSVLFREHDCGRFKAEVAAERARDLFPGIRIKPLCLNVVSELGLGFFFWADLIIGGLDNREARLSINRNSYRAGKTWIDGAIEVLNGTARVFTPPDGPCYECTMSQVDWQMLQARRACTLLNRDEIMSGKTPTTPTMASVIAGIQCQEALKIIHGIESLPGKGYVFNGRTFDNYVVEYKRKTDCYSHEFFSPVKTLPEKASELTLSAALKIVKNDLGEDAFIEIREDVLTGFFCVECSDREPYHSHISKVREKDTTCKKCGKLRLPELSHSFYGNENYIELTLSKLGIPAFDVFSGRNAETTLHYLLDGDRESMIEPLDSEVSIEQQKEHK
ncbi:MAG: HesA/MoeB/ThiF family protein [Candidatus Riflebacteria bacterium]|nr:HesA/MoeB/ThiF family protein [Candidatus Riflebacteria bacterium]